MNLTDSTEDQIVVISHSLYYAIFTPFFLVGIVGNGLLIFIIACHERMRTVPNSFICNLAVTSLLSLAMATLYPYLDDDEDVGKTVCLLTKLVRRSCVTINTLTLTALTVERYYTIAYARNVFLVCGSIVTKITVSLIWCNSFLLAIITISSSEYRCFSSSSKCLCSKAWGDRIPIFSLFIFVVLIPLLTITILYILMAKDFYKNVPSVKNQKLKKTAWVVLALIIVFALTHLPFYAISLVYYNTTNPYMKTTAVLFSLTNLQACGNPFVLYGFSEPCRTHINHYVSRLLLWCEKRLDSSKENSGNAQDSNPVTRSDEQTPSISGTCI